MTTLPFADLEAAYETLARAIDAAGPEKEALFLARLALVLAHEGGDIGLFRRAVADGAPGHRAGRGRADGGRGAWRGLSRAASLDRAARLVYI